ncbi:hypothetical protein AXF42_Ash015528 [Apostasia shenzhenica]|uniref:Uncharacterized protein n=1 Tax=Apostasia shenzhenica TaxID=1088818 RepID=A0A2I0AKF7_9ASPA|nr:hypothetical protein AXF42_Ash015528 [Apostasia shenzhenica]
MPVQLVAVAAAAKLKLLAVGGHGNCRLLPALLLPFILRVPFAARVPPSLTGAAHAVRLLVFQLRSMLLQRSPAANGRRTTARTLGMLYNRVAGSGRSLIGESDAEALYALSMASL